MRARWARWYSSEKHRSRRDNAQDQDTFHTSPYQYIYLESRSTLLSLSAVLLEWLGSHPESPGSGFGSCTLFPPPYTFPFSEKSRQNSANSPSSRQRGIGEDHLKNTMVLAMPRKKKRWANLFPQKQRSDFRFHHRNWIWGLK